jgi:ribonuclease D
MAIDEVEEEPAELPVLAAPGEPLADVVTTPDALAAAIAQLRSGAGPVAVDAERAHGYRYSARAYLIQLRRAGSGTLLIDPIPFATDTAAADFSPLRAAIADEEWIIHAASQDLPCLVEIGMVPSALFDTELAGRLLGHPRVGLGALIEQYFGQRLLKEHSAADWSTRPLPREWLTYAALDVELLIELRARLLDELVMAGKDEWARQEFQWLTERATVPTPPRVDPWRRTSGIHAVRSPAGLAVVRELWETRDRIARSLDRAPGRILPDRAISALAARPTPDRAALRAVDGFRRRNAKRYEDDWLAALERARALSKAELPPLHVPTDGPPPPRSWEHRHPEAYGRYLALRAVTNELAERHNLPAENLLTPDLWRRLAWQPPDPLTRRDVDEFLVRLGARQWQRDLVVDPLTMALLS